jgi:hypothetical protein
MDLHASTLQFLVERPLKRKPETPERAELFACESLKSKTGLFFTLQKNLTALSFPRSLSWKSPCGVASMNGNAITAVLSPLQTVRSFYRLINRLSRFSRLPHFGTTSANGVLSVQSSPEAPENVM